jgi:alpha-D-ribose 1-methylphosphonate 5-phosphate C-P lyase
LIVSGFETAVLFTLVRLAKRAERRAIVNALGLQNRQLTFASKNVERVEGKNVSGGLECKWSVSQSATLESVID